MALCLAVGLFVSLQLPALRDLYKFLPARYFPISHAYVVLSCLVYSVVTYGAYTKGPFSWKLRGTLESKVLCVVLLSAIVLLVAYVYPVVDGLKYFGRGSDQDDGLIAACSALLKGENPYSVSIPFFGRNPISPGPGWVVMALPFVATHAYFLFAPVAVAAAALALRLVTKEWAGPSAFILLLLSSIIFWDLLVEGSDLVPLGCALLMVALVLFRMSLSVRNVVLAGVVVGVLATARVPFIYLPLLFGVVLATRDRWRAVQLAVLGTVVAVAFHGFFIWWCRLAGDTYQPFHLLGKGAAFLPGGFRLAAVAVCMAVAILIIKLPKRKLWQSLMAFWLGLYVPLLCVAVGDLVFTRKLHVAAWEGANYLMPPLPVFLAAYVAWFVDRTGARETDNAQGG